MDRRITYAAIVVLAIVIIVVIASQSQKIDGFSGCRSGTSNAYQFFMAPVPGPAIRGGASPVSLVGAGVGTRSIPAGTLRRGRVTFSATVWVQTVSDNAMVAFSLALGSYVSQFAFRLGKAGSTTLDFEIVMLPVSRDGSVALQWTVTPGGLEPVTVQKSIDGMNPDVDYPVDFLGAMMDVQATNPGNQFQTFSFMIMI